MCQVVASPSRRVGCPDHWRTSGVVRGRPSTPIDAVIKLTSTGTKNGSQTKIVAVVEFGITGSVINVDPESWRVCENAGTC